MKKVTQEQAKKRAAKLARKAKRDAGKPKKKASAPINKSNLDDILDISKSLV